MLDFNDTEYHKIQSIFKRDMEKPGKRLIESAWTMPEFEYLANNTWELTEKVDGTNIRVFFKDGEIKYGGRTNNAQIPAKLVTRLNERFLYLKEALEVNFPDGVVLYGEGYGAGIQKGGGNYRPDQDFVLFDVRVEQWWLSRKDVRNVAAKLGLDTVPFVGYGTLYDAISLVKHGKFASRWGDFQAEGIVARPKVELQTRAGHRIIAKIKCRDFE